MDAAKRKGLQTAVAALCVEAGYTSADRAAIETITQVLQGYICELGRTSRTYCELSQRSIPTIPDVQLALIDLGSRNLKLDEYSQRPQRRHLPRQVRNYPQPHGKLLQIGNKRPRPPHVPLHLPPYPDNHTFIKTATYCIPHTDYRSVRDKVADQRSHSRRSLSQFLAKTCLSCPITGETDNEGLYAVLLPQTSDCPVYLKALMPSDNDKLEPEFKRLNSDLSTTDHSDQCDQQTNEDKGVYEENETKSTDLPYQNPFLKSARKMPNL